jgi:hypothetical protein
MKHRGISLATGMFAILLLAANLAAFRSLTWPGLAPTSLNLALSLLPMLNVVAVLGYRLMLDPTARHPFVIGFFISGIEAMLAHVACDRLYPEQMERAYFVPVNPFFELCQAYRVPYHVGATPEGHAYFRYYPALALAFCMPQFLVAGLGGLNCLLVARLAPRRPHNSEPDQTQLAAKNGNGEV